MTSAMLAFYQPPWGITTPATPQAIIATVLALVVAGFVVAASASWQRTTQPTFLILLAGGYICSFNEATVDVLGHCFFPNDGVLSYTAFGRGVPVWVVLAYVIFFGGLSHVMAAAFKNGASRATMWTGIAIFGVLNVVLEMPMLGAGLYVYYGYQPFAIGGFPISWLVINSLGSLFGAVVMVRLSWFFTGARQLLLVLVPFATYMSSWLLAMPHFAITNTDMPAGVRMVAAAASMVLGVIAIDTFIRIGTGQSRLLPPSSLVISENDRYLNDSTRPSIGPEKTDEITYVA